MHLQPATDYDRKQACPGSKSQQDHPSLYPAILLVNDPRHLSELVDSSPTRRRGCDFEVLFYLTRGHADDIAEEGECFGMAFFAILRPGPDSTGQRDKAR